MTLSEFIEIYKKRKTGKDSLDRDIQHLSYIVELMGNKRLQAYREDDFQELEEKLLAKERAPSAVNRYFQVLHHLFDIAIKERAVAKNPLDDFEYFIEDESRGHALSDEEITTLQGTSIRFETTPSPAKTSNPRSTIWPFSASAQEPGFRRSFFSAMTKSTATSPASRSRRRNSGNAGSDRASKKS